MAAERFTTSELHSGGDTPDSGNDIMSMTTDELLVSTTEEKSRQQKQAALKELVLRRDGHLCPLTHANFDADAVDLVLTYINSNSVYDRPDTLKYITMLAGAVTRDRVVQQLNTLDNLTTSQSDAHTAHDNLKWDGRLAPIPLDQIQGYEIPFGGGPDGLKLGSGPDSLLCNLQLAVARVLKMSAAAKPITQMKGDADDSGYPHVYIASVAFCDIVTAKLLLSGRAPPM
ncbi:hypothetical protein F5I97DRAFT_1927601 [Phlebopus sp. FC_14]|nr:hypothetical protein F5I97DRAFT_1927601 [Phlebopus sp. FC_14]